MACHTYPCPNLDVDPAWATWDATTTWVAAVPAEQFVLGGLTGLSDSSNFTAVGTVKVQGCFTFDTTPHPLLQVGKGWFAQLMQATGPMAARDWRPQSPTPPPPSSPQRQAPLPDESQGFPFGTKWQFYSLPVAIMLCVFFAGTLSVCTVFCCARRAFPRPVCIHRYCTMLHMVPRPSGLAWRT